MSASLSHHLPQARPAGSSPRPGPVIGFALLSPRERPQPSTRIACLNLFSHLQQAGYQPRILWEPKTGGETPVLPPLEQFLAGADPALVVFQKIHGPAVVDMVQQLRARGIRTAWCVCDLVDNPMAAATDATIAVTAFLKSLYQPALHSRIHVVHDGIEDEGLRALAVGRRRGPPRALLVTSQELQALPVIGTAPAGWRVDVVGRYALTRLQRLRHLYWRVAVAGAAAAWKMVKGAWDPRISPIPWSPAAVAQGVARAQIGIIPVDTGDPHPAKGSREPVWRVKSENRLTLLMAAGLPVIATPIPAYETIVDHGRNGFFARSRADWLALFKTLRDPDLRLEVGARARASVLPAYSVQAQAERFLQVVGQLL